MFREENVQLLNQTHTTENITLNFSFTFFICNFVGFFFHLTIWIFTQKEVVFQREL